MRVGTIYSASDKSLFDALNQKNVTNSELRQLFLTRGILVSPETSRKALAKHFARLFHDYHDYQTLAKLFGSGSSREKISTIRVDTSASLKEFESGVFELKSDLESAGALVKVFQGRGNRLDIEVRYTKVQFNKSEFRQVTNRVAMISFRSEDGGIVIDSPYSDEAREWVDTIAKSVRDKGVEKFEFDEIQLSPGLSAKKKTSFFTLLINNMPDLPLKDVSDVYVTKPTERTDEPDLEAGNAEIRIDKASLKGQGVLESQELALLEKRGFYVSRIIWTAKGKNVDSDIYEFEAQFASPEECQDFVYLSRGFYKCLNIGEFSKSRAAFTREEEQRYGAMIESAARKSLREVNRS